MALAVVRLTTSSNLIGCSIGRSAGLVPCKILVHVRGAAAEQVGQARAVGQEAAGGGNLPGYEHSRQPIVGEKIDDPADAELVKGIVGHQERIGTLPDHGSEGAVEFSGTAHRDRDQLYPQRLYRRSQLCELGRVRGIVRFQRKATRERRESPP